MPGSSDQLRDRLQAFDFRGLLVEGLGWNYYQAAPLVVPVDDYDYSLEPVAEKAGFAVYTCGHGPGGAIPPYPTRRKIEHEVAKLAFEHLLVFVDAGQRTQVWQWVKRETGVRDVCREQWFRRGLSGESLLQSLRDMAFALAEEATIDALGVALRVRRAMDKETLYSRFSEGFRRRTVAGETDPPQGERAAASAAEVAFSSELANALRGKHPRWSERVDRISGLDGHAEQYPGIVIRHPGGAPVVVTTGFDRVEAAEAAACDSLGSSVEGADGDVEQAIAVRVPDELRGDQQLTTERLDEAEFRYCVFTRRDAEPGDPARWPEAGWLNGSIDDLAGLIEQAALSERRIADGMLILEEGVGQAATMLRSGVGSGAAACLARIAAELHQEDGEQTSRMAMTIVANALTVHSGIAEAHGVTTLQDLRVDRGRLTKAGVLEAWQEILKINYWPIFDIARKVLAPIPDQVAQSVLERLHAVASDLALIGATSTQDLAGQMFGRLIADRKFLATFYTLPSSAALLAELAVSRLGVDWADEKKVTGLRIADLACGTGVLLSAAYRAVAARHRRAGGDDAALHRAMMENSLVGADIMPAATHLTTSMVSSAHPTVTFGRTQIHTMRYGEQTDGDGGAVAIAIGSLDLIENDTALTLFSTGPAVVTGTGADERAEGFQEKVLAAQAADLVIMNPPFTRPTNHESGHDVPVPSFAGFATSSEEQQKMAVALKTVRSRLSKPAGDGNAGLASNFIDLAHQKIKPGGVMALVLPLTVASGGSWTAVRHLLARHYCEITVITLATTGQSTRAFSADTGMGEALVVALKREALVEARPADVRALYVNLRERPASAVDALDVARAIMRIPSEEAGFIRSGDDEIGCYIRAALADGGCTSLREPYAATAAIGLSAGALRLPWQADTLPLPVTALGELGNRGLVDRDINGMNTGGRPRGPFDVLPGLVPDSERPVLWGHDADRERRLVVQPDGEATVRHGQDVRAREVWATATRLHFNRDFRLNSQSLAACLTPKKSIGGRAWPNFKVEGDERREEALVLWANTTPGLMCFWWIAGRQQQGRAILTISGLPALPVLDVRALHTTQLAIAQRIFEEFQDWTFLPANEAYRDDTRKALDRAVLCELLGLPESILEPLGVLREQWCAEPTVHGGKSTRPTIGR